MVSKLGTRTVEQLTPRHAYLTFVAVAAGFNNLKFWRRDCTALKSC
jgi:hypothetical protein